MTAESGTDHLIHGLAQQAGTARLPTPRRFIFILGIAGLAGLGISVALVLSLVGVRPDFAIAVSRAPFIYKVTSMLLLSLGGMVLASRAALPGSGRLPVSVLLPALLLLGFRAATDHSGLSMMGESDISVDGCMLMIIIISLPTLVILLMVLRMAAPTRPALTGAIGGLLSGALGAAAYALICRNDAGLFVAIWYPLAILVLVSLGAAIGWRALRW